MESCWSDFAKGSNERGKQTSGMSMAKRFMSENGLTRSMRYHGVGNTAYCLVQTSSLSIWVIIGVGILRYPMSGHTELQRRGEVFMCGRGTADSRSMARISGSHT